MRISSSRGTLDIRKQTANTENDFWESCGQRKSGSVYVLIMLFLDYCNFSIPRQICRISLNSLLPWPDNYHYLELTIFSLCLGDKTDTASGGNLSGCRSSILWLEFIDYRKWLGWFCVPLLLAYAAENKWAPLCWVLCFILGSLWHSGCCPSPSAVCDGKEGCLLVPNS